jgi:hypothetical protein
MRHGRIAVSGISLGPDFSSRLEEAPLALVAGKVPSGLEVYRRGRRSLAAQLELTQGRRKKWVQRAVIGDADTFLCA